MKKQLFLIAFISFSICAGAQSFDVKSKNFTEVFTLLYQSAGHYFKEVKGKPITSNFFSTIDTIGFRILQLPEGVTDWKHLDLGADGSITLFFKLGEYSTDSAEVARRFSDCIALIKQIDPAVVITEDNKYSDTKVKEVYSCSSAATPCTEEGKWRVNLYFHRFSNKEFNVSVNIQSFPL